MAAIGAGPPSRGPWLAVAGTRPNYVKLAPLVRAAQARGSDLVWIDTGQHTDPRLRDATLADVGLPAARVTLTAPVPGPDRIEHMAAALGVVLEAHAPSVVIVLGDVDSTAAAALAAWRLDLPLVHVEAGLRSQDASMPEERNRILADALSDRHYLTEPGAAVHLEAEGVESERLVVAGNVMADALAFARPRVRAVQRPEGLTDAGYVVATLHRQGTVDDPRRLAQWVEALGRIAADRPVLLPVHPRTEARLGGAEALAAAGIRALKPQPYLAFLALVSRAAAVITDSGGLPLEAALLGVPCVIARDRLEHELVLSHGGAVLAGEDPSRLAEALRAAEDRGGSLPARPFAWDGRAAERIVADLRTGFPRACRRVPPADSGV